ncbi:MAG: hypothetical protein KJ697_00335 [Nanoarchaeota archaeon]|nr:hypothetical protein [Nanoarchaeota archaeon]MBU4124235.1 hypothetical protein [Nanoarchaeota archaeon]
MKLVAIALLLIIIFSMSSFAFVMSGPNYKINAIISNGGKSITGIYTETPYTMHFALMQPIIKSFLDKTDTTNYKLCLGIFCTGLFEVPHYVTVSGTVYYDTGGVVADSEAKLVVNVANGNYKSGMFRTDANGGFTTKVAVPETIMKKEGTLIKPFGIKVYVTGRVEAVYSCTFYPDPVVANLGTCY